MCLFFSGFAACVCISVWWRVEQLNRPCHCSSEPSRLNGELVLASHYTASGAWGMSAPVPVAPPTAAAPPPVPPAAIVPIQSATALTKHGLRQFVETHNGVRLFIQCVDSGRRPALPRFTPLLCCLVQQKLCVHCEPERGAGLGTDCHPRPECRVQSAGAWPRLWGLRPPCHSPSHSPCMTDCVRAGCAEVLRRCDPAARPKSNCSAVRVGQGARPLLALRRACCCVCGVCAERKCCPGPDAACVPPCVCWLCRWW